MVHPDRLSDQVLNRTLLQRQHLLRRAPLSPQDLAAHLVGLQAQDSLPPYIGMFSRISGFDPAALSRTLESRELVRVTLMRGTIHLVTAEDAARMRPIFQPEFEKAIDRPGFFFGALDGLAPETIRRQGEAVFGDTPLSAADVRAAAKRAFPDRDPSAIAQAWYYQLPVLQVPPRGLWRTSGPPTWARIEDWLGRDLARDYPPSEVVARYLAAFGPATTQDIAAWSRLPGVAELISNLGPRIRPYLNTSGQTLYDVEDGALADPDSEAPVRFLGWYDNVYLSHKDRARIVASDISAQLWNGETRNISPILVDGFIQGGYRILTGKKGDPVEMRIRMVATTSAESLEYVEKEAVRLLEFLEPDRPAVIAFVTRL
ncbi:winged helix DNA-binding domain-containing protein [Hoyosella sp. YIM 151337]|uniref:winged helix DNA-binding domain-containing protein n=1 Tax=Hoyosella sp. YIM 151337 TaxID=2992742 RepID=UPI00223558D5|nr:winged helix DNA-binding domain-containing protein [Hoyosella sp. YIM 151337]MCW4353727.1 winged helix DNA-binding domain-containing protein [Hoyosella sp. YIM 151337]